MRGHILQRGSKYSFVIDIGRDPVTKKRRQKRVSGFTSKKKAQTAMNDMIAELNRGSYVEPSTETLNDYLDAWLKHKQKRVAHSTYLHYKTYIENHIKTALGNTRVFDLKARQVQQFYDSLLEQGHLSERSIHHIHRILSNALEKGARIGDVQKNVAKAVEPASVRKKEMKHWNMNTLKGFLELTRREPHFIAWYLAAFTGMRQGEILGLKWDCVDWGNKTIFVRRALKRDERKYIIADLKNNASYRSISISDTDVFELRKYFNEQKEQKVKVGKDYDNQNLVVATALGTHLLPSNLGRAFRRCLKQTEVDKIRFHDLRHTHASMLFGLKAHPKIVQERLGHSSIQVTLDTYSHMLPNMQEAVAESLESAFQKEEKDKNKNSL
ncbi:AP2-like DNA-binding integrase domain-containing protein [Virgibacillus subterraneus]|uniref:AP2-like DNA-binding integrase domain-containing protein n=1 Tax=Virgibacillus subterraneus TaxID=621109 RepID=A0A1H8Z037_9BACI|nr:site-specific integrase [Virgibacillus subterraneus]SEP57879.1 AP2-like DNA-binding integrase domain-containing protein [Virgibacillus subterraneus]